MFRPKMDAVALLHKLSLGHPVQQFVLFSSISGVLGSRWLAHYAATTTFLDTFAFARRAAGLPACAINWGLWKSLADVQTGFDRQATAEFGPGADGRRRRDHRAAVARRLAGAGTDHRGRRRLAAAGRRLPHPGRSCTSSTTCSAAEAGANAPALTGDTKFREELRECDPERRHDLLTDHVGCQVAEAMGLASADALDPTVGFFQFGMDSLMSVTLAAGAESKASARCCRRRWCSTTRPWKRSPIIWHRFCLR